MLAQGAVSFIKQGCNMLHEGRMELEGAKKTVEGVLADVKAIKGIFQWFIGLFKGVKSPQPNSSPSASTLHDFGKCHRSQTQGEEHMIESILTIIALLLVGACVGVGVIIAILYFSMDND